MRSRTALVVAAALVVAVGIGGALWWRHREADRDDAAQAAATAFKDLGDAKVAVTAGDVERDGDTATGTLDVTWTLPGDVPWTYAVPVTLVADGDRWQVATPATVSPWHPDLPAGTTMQLERTFGQRGDLLDRDGKPLMPLGTVHAVQIDPVNATAASAAALEPIVGATKGSLTQALARSTASGSKAPIPVITYRDSD